MIKRILVIIDPGQDNMLALNRASLLAEKTNCTLEVLLSVDSPKIHSFGELCKEDILDQIRLAEETKLDEMVQPLVDYGFEVKTKVILHKPAIDGILNQIQSGSVDLVIKASDYHPSIKRSIFSFLDWQLIRDVPCPLMLCKNAHWSDHPSIAVAVDPIHDQGDIASLDDKLIKAGQSLQKHTDGTLQLLHVWDSSLVSTAILTLEENKEKHQVGLTKLAQEHGVEEGACQLLSGAPEVQLASYVNTSNVDLLITGAISRSIIGSKIIGYTAERLLDRLRCDLLVIKPE